ncbi:Peptidoglycan/xylan/chitin deacetylase, PgdA/CDA1 family [Lishizhenia tianjinensis]|uniref:Peptidoglycan/xylan/chitin deacetylase, PgdA/CDA1 family n=1 Tax=Lishizhenia tianjinensis TaxID=477690 RepID=A0A1I7AYF8_9FLAO|nr:polysaccharide deacetylase family protein [Lishizhenia tianjinensis]SFT79929.1 Peptidoglycan/xylan/chitin deacetylase, PgdA/CDA1 family [Lishizhenia tianjinensis]
MQLFKTPVFVQKVFPKRNWSFSVSTPILFLTFDDGPEPSVTPQVLDLLKEYNAKATFFCVGENVKNHPELFQRLKAEGHAVGNHTMHHKNALKFGKKEYLENVKEANHYIQSKLFRPPYGRLDGVKGAALLKDYHIVMWSFLTYDYDAKVPLEEIKEKLKELKSGDIVVLHDNKKSKERSLDLLKYILELALARGWKCEAISSELCK